MTHRIDLWIATFVAALPRYGEEQAPNVADRAVEAFDKRLFSSPPQSEAKAALAEVKKLEEPKK